MINDWKLGIKIMRYAHGIKINCILGGFMLVLAILSSVLAGTVRDALPATYFILVVGMLPVQMLYSLSITGMVQTAPIKKKLQTKIPAMVNFSITAVMYLVVVLIYGIMLIGNPTNRSWVCRNLMILSLMIAIVMLYMGVAYKYFIVATVLMMPLLCTALSTGLLQEKWILDFVPWERFTFWQATLGGIVILAVGGFMQYLLSLLVYKAPIDKLSQVATLRRWM